MFELFRKKLSYTLSISVSLILLFIFSSLYFYTNHTIHTDFAKRTKSLSKRYTESISFRLANISEATSYFQNTYHLYTYFESDVDQIKINQILTDIKTYNLCIKGASILCENGSFFYSDNKYNQFFFNTCFADDFKVWFQKQNGNNNWQLFNNALQNEASDNLNGILYITPIKNNNKIYGYLIVDVSLISLFSSFNFQENIFLSNGSVKISDQNSEIIIYQNRSNNNKNKQLQSYHNIKNTNLSVHFLISPEYITKQQLIAFSVLLIAFIILIIIFLTSLRFLLKDIVSPLECLYSEMNDYITTCSNRTSS